VWGEKWGRLWEDHPKGRIFAIFRLALVTPTGIEPVFQP